MWRGFARSVSGYGGLTPFHLLGLPPPPGTWHRLRGCSATGARDPLAEVPSRHDAEALKALDAPGGAIQFGRLAVIGSLGMGYAGVSASRGGRGRGGVRPAGRRG